MRKKIGGVGRAVALPRAKFRILRALGHPFSSVSGPLCACLKFVPQKFLDAETEG